MIPSNRGSRSKKQRLRRKHEKSRDRKIRRQSGKPMESLGRGDIRDNKERHTPSSFRKTDIDY